MRNKEKRDAFFAHLFARKIGKKSSMRKSRDIFRTLGQLTDESKMSCATSNLLLFIMKQPASSYVKPFRKEQSMFSLFLTATRIGRIAFIGIAARYFKAGDTNCPQLRTYLSTIQHKIVLEQKKMGKL